MHKILLASAAAVLLTGSLANAQFLLGQDENGHKQVTNLAAVQAIGGDRHAARIATATFGEAGGAFLLGQDDNGNKAAVNTYGSGRSAAWMAQDGIAMSTSGAGAVSPAFLLGQDANGNKAVVNQYSR